MKKVFRGLMIWAVLASMLVFASVSASAKEIVQYDFDNDTEGAMKIIDQSGNKNDGVFMDEYEIGVEFDSSAKFGKALKLDGASQYFEFPKSVMDHENITIAFWVYWRGGQAWQLLFEVGSPDHGEHFIVCPENQAGIWQLSAYNKGEDSSFVVAPSDTAFKTLPKNQWVHFAVTQAADGTTAYYLNGKPAKVSGTITTNGTERTIKNATTFKSPVHIRYVNDATYTKNNPQVGISNGTIYRRFGCTATGFGNPMFNGSFDAIRVYDTVLSESQIGVLMNTNSVPADTTTAGGGNTVAPTAPGQTAATTGGNTPGNTTNPQATETGDASTSDTENTSDVSDETSADTSADADVTNASTSGTTSANDTDDTKGAPVGLIVGIIAAVLVAAGGVCLFLFRDKIFKKKS